MPVIIFLVTVIFSLFALSNPLSAVPVMATLTEGYSESERRNVIRKAISVQVGMFIGFMFLGEYIFTGLGINIADFEIAGGALLFKVAFDMLQGRLSNTKITPVEQAEYSEREAVGIVPLGVPFLAGPGSVTTAIIYFNSKSNGLMDRLSVIAAVFVIALLSFIILRYSTVIIDRMGKSGSLIISRIMGLLIAAIGVSFIVTGITSVVTKMGF
jgi:multiple antibiotic resistance protein